MKEPLDLKSARNTSKSLAPLIANVARQWRQTKSVSKEKQIGEKPRLYGNEKKAGKDFACCLFRLFLRYFWKCRSLRLHVWLDINFIFTEASTGTHIIEYWSGTFLNSFHISFCICLSSLFVYYYHSYFPISMLKQDILGLLLEIRSQKISSNLLHFHFCLRTL